MKKAACGLCGACCILLIWCAAFYLQLDGQIQAHFTARWDQSLQTELQKRLENEDAQMGLYAVLESDIGSLEDGSIYECIFYHPDAIGIQIIEGAAITQAQIEADDAVMMLSEGAAMRMDPNMNLIGTKTMLNGREYTIIGIYRQRSPLGMLTRRSELSAVIPFRMTDQPRVLRLWLYTAGNTRFLYQKLQSCIADLNQSADVGSMNVRNLGTAARLGRQRAYIWLWIGCTAFCIGLLRRWRGRRRRFLENAQQLYAREEFPVFARTGLRWAMQAYLPSMLAAAFWIAASIWLIAGFCFDETVLPRRFLSLKAWYEMLVQNAIRTNESHFWPTLQGALYDRLRHLVSILGSLGVGTILYIFKGRND